MIDDRELNDYPLDMVLDDLLVKLDVEPVKIEGYKETYRKDDHLYIVQKDYSLRVKPNYFKLEKRT